MAGLNVAPSTPDIGSVQPPSIILPDGVASWARDGVAWAMENGISDGQEANHTKNTPLTKVMKANLFDAEVLAEFIDYLDDGNLWN